ncbi:MAG: DUF4365 domain-containing protein [Spirochaetia bacterium]|jgi:hypothetical protein|nr:DUF4365 domain-containing protein [Spirochaetia bacterium]
MKVSGNDQQGDSGVYAVGKRFNDIFGWIFRPQSQRDYGIDALVEVVENNQTRGELLALQIKSGQSWFKERDSKGIVFRSDVEHLDYWQSYSLPVLVLLHHPEEDQVYWQVVNFSTIEKLEKGWKLILPNENRLDKNNIDKIKNFCSYHISKKSYSLYKLEDMSLALAKRYSAQILLNDKLSRGEIVQLINSITNNLIYREYYRNEITKVHWSKKPASVAWTTIYKNYEDLVNNNWICRSQWISKDLPKENAPGAEKGEKIGDELVIIWSTIYDQLGDIYNDDINKEDYLEVAEKLDVCCYKQYEKIKNLFSKYTDNKISKTKFYLKIKKFISELESIDQKFNAIEIPPLECKEYNELLYGGFVDLDNIRLVIENEKSGISNEDNMKYLVSMYLKSYGKAIDKIKYEHSKL